MNKEEADALLLKACQEVKTWLDLNARQGSVIYRPLCDAIKECSK